jgi:hypothetical protein
MELTNLNSHISINFSGASSTYITKKSSRTMKREIFYKKAIKQSQPISKIELIT